MQNIQKSAMVLFLLATALFVATLFGKPTLIGNNNVQLISDIDYIE